MTTKADLDKLVDWYEANKPEAGHRIQVPVGPQTLAKICGQKPGKNSPREQPYRGRTIVATKVVDKTP